MTSLVSDFIIDPVLRQARRLSSNFAGTRPEPAVGDTTTPAVCEDGTSEMEEDGSSETAALSWSRPAPIPTGSVMTRQSEPENHDALAALQISSPVRPSTALGAEASQPIRIERSSRDGLPLPSSLPSSFYGRAELPEDDGMGALRRRIIGIQSQRISPAGKAKLMHDLLMEGYTRSQIARQAKLPIRPQTPSSPTEQPALTGPLDSFKFWQGVLGESPAAQKFILTENDVRPTFVPVPEAGRMGLDEAEGHDLASSRILGCEHYRRNVKMQCFTCQRWHTCRLCHNDAEDHVLPRRETKNMLCMLCGYAQRAGEMCVKCGESAARYYCNICKLWNDDPDKSIYHCNDCGICRVGEGLGKDFFHCKKCGSCIAITMEASHRCREGAMDCDCPICGEYMFTSHKKVLSMKCGHMIHDVCRKEYIKTSYRCPICSKSVENMESQFRRLDKHLQEQPMPPEYQHTRATILCNDCEAKTSTKYHWGGLKCEVCLSYNTVELQILNSPAIPAMVVREGADVALRPEPQMHATPRLGGVGLTGLPAQSPESPLTSLEEPRTMTQSTAERFLRSAFPASVLRVPDHLPVTDESDQEEDMLDFWGRDERRSATSAENPDDGQSEGEDGDDDSDSEACDDADEEEDDEGEIVLFGHR